MFVAFETLRNMLLTPNQDLIANVTKRFSGQWLGKYVSQIFFGGDMSGHNYFVVSQHLNPMLALINVTKLGVGCCVVAEYFGSSIVHLQDNGLRKWLSHFFDNVR